MVTPVEVGAGKKAFDWLKGGATYLWKLGKSVATLEERVTALEATLKTASADACPYCFAPNMRLKHQSGLLGNPGQQWTEDTWTCDKCGKDYIEREELKKARRS
jgi:uncharacterized protein with PIN domain